MYFDPDKPIEKYRINLPHWQQGEVWIFLTWRLADSLPKTVVERISSERETWEKAHPKPWDANTLKESNRLFTLRFESLLDDCHGSCCLRDPAARQVIDGALRFFDGSRYMLDSFVVMPNHVHVLFRIFESHHLQDIVHSWKSFTAHRINKILGRTGTLWQREYWDRLIRSQRHYDWTRNYILKNSARMLKGSFDLYMKMDNSEP